MYVKWKELMISIAISLAVGFLAGFLIKDRVAIYDELVKPPLSPPKGLFSIVWTLLYIMMGISAYLVYQSDSDKKEKQDALRVYIIQLILNFSWSLIFFSLQAYLLAFIILILLWFSIYIMIERFGAISMMAGKLQMPYLLWVMFAGYLNLAIICLNNNLM
jgi:benzodiazapine receptor